MAEDLDLNELASIEASLTPEEYRGYLKGRVFYHLWRMEHGGTRLADAQTALWYLMRLSDHVGANV